MIFSVAEIVSFLSQGMTLLPGMLNTCLCPLVASNSRSGTFIFTGTPAGVGFGKRPQIEMKEGDITKVEIDGIGGIANKVVYEQ